MSICELCKQPFDPNRLPDSPSIQAGLILAKERYGDSGGVCATCLANRGCLAIMYDPEYRR